MASRIPGAAGGLAGAWGTLALLSLSVLAPAAGADDRRFTFLYQTTTLPRAHHEYEQWATWKTGKDTDDAYDRLEFRQEFEHGITDNLQLAIYLATWRYTRTGEGSNTTVHDTAVEVVYNLSDVETTLLGVALYGEVKLDSRLFELEGKLLLEKEIGPWVVAYNGVVEAEWEGENWSENKGKIAQLLGLSRRVASRLALGAEFLFEVEIEGWQEAGPGLTYAGPNVSVAGQGWRATVTSLFQLSDEGAEPDLQLRTLIGVPF